jgi:aminopeptidase N
LKIELVIDVSNKDYYKSTSIIKTNIKYDFLNKKNIKNKYKNIIYLNQNEEITELCFLNKYSTKSSGLFRSEFNDIYSILEENGSSEVFLCSDDPSVLYEIKASIVKNKKEVYRFESEYDIPAYQCLFALNNLNLNSYKSNEYNINLYGLKTPNINDVKSIINYCENIFNLKYPLKQLNIYMIDELAFPGAESHGSILLKSGNENNNWLLAHEIIHMWIGNIIFIPSWDFYWFKEAITEWFTYKYFNSSDYNTKIYGKMAKEIEIINQKKSVLNIIQQYINDYKYQTIPKKEIIKHFNLLTKFK